MVSSGRGRSWTSAGRQFDAPGKYDEYTTSGAAYGPNGYVIDGKFYNNLERGSPFSAMAWRSADLQS